MGKCAVCGGPDFYDGCIDSDGEYVCLDCWASGEAQDRTATVATFASEDKIEYPNEMRQNFVKACNGER